MELVGHALDSKVGLSTRITCMRTRNCYCDLWEKNPELLEPQSISRGFCAICERCSQPGHMRHAPGAAPYTGAWCDRCYRVATIRNNARMLMFIGIVAGLIFALRELVRWLCM